MSRDLIYILILASTVAYFLLFPQKKVEIETEYIKGDTVTVIDTVTVYDKVTEYVFSAQIDTLRLRDTVYVAYSSPFQLGDSALGTSGVVTFALEEFTFKDIEYTYPEFTNTVVDTLKITKTVPPPIYKDVWFWSTAVATTLLFLSLAGG